MNCCKLVQTLHAVLNLTISSVSSYKPTVCKEINHGREMND